MSRETKASKAPKRKPKRSPKKVVREADDSREIVRESQSDTYNPWAYFAKYFDQI